jgi:thiol-disulfide isomerase/thioredoxin
MKLALTLLLALAVDSSRERNAEEMFKDALAAAKESKREVFLTFGTPDCGWCVKFEAWKRKPEVAALLEKEFVLLHVDLTKTPGGKELYEKYPKAQSGGVPWFVIHDGDRNELADSNGPKGNIGCPDTDEEIEVFMGILKKVCRTLKDADIAALKASILENRNK